jgi:hypothetical protein
MVHWARRFPNEHHAIKTVVPVVSAGNEAESPRLPG